MIRNNILKLSALFLTRNKTLFRQTIERKLTITPPLLKEKKKQNNSNSQKKTENKKSTFQEAKKRIYYKFLCKCGVGFDDFSEFLEHVKVSHQIEDLNFQEILTKKNGFERGIKFYWSLSCQCGHKFSSSLCNADLRVNERKIEILKKYQLRCLKCRQIAKFDVEELLNKFLKEKFKQKLIYNFYKKEFAKFEKERDSGKVLEGHIKALCEKCQLSPTGYCGDELNYQEQTSQILYIPPFVKR